MKSDENLMKLPFHQIFIRFHQISSDFLFFYFFIFCFETKKEKIFQDKFA